MLDKEYSFIALKVYWAYRRAQRNEHISHVLNCVRPATNIGTSLPDAQKRRNVDKIPPPRLCKYRHTRLQLEQGNHLLLTTGSGDSN
jgi:hypothetical protein